MFYINYKFLFKFVTLGLLIITASATGIYGADQLLAKDVGLAEASGKNSPYPTPHPTASFKPQNKYICKPGDMCFELNKKPEDRHFPTPRPTSYPVYKVRDDFQMHKEPRHEFKNKPDNIRTFNPPMHHPEDHQIKLETNFVVTDCPGGWSKQVRGVATVCIPDNQLNQTQNQNQNQDQNQNQNQNQTQNNNQNQNVNTNIVVGGGSSSSSSSSSSSNSVDINLEKIHF